MRRVLVCFAWAAVLAAFSVGVANRMALAQSGNDQAPPQEIVRVPCDEVLAAETHEVHLRQGRALNLLRMAQQLGTSVLWVERCLESYGRMPVGVDMKSGAEQEGLIDQFERRELEEGAGENGGQPTPQQLPVGAALPKEQQPSGH